MVLLYILGWQTISPFKPSGREVSTKATVIITARNEQENITKLLTCLKNQTYSKDLFEVIVVDDHSTDLTPDIVESFEMDNLRLIHLGHHIDRDIIAFKKRAVEVAVSQSDGELIITTDADCVMGKNWLLQIVSFYEETDSKFIVAPVDYNPINTMLDKLQNLDFLSLMGVTGATVKLKMNTLSNGANMAYEREAFLKVKGYKGVDKSPSGDDIFLIEKMGKVYPEQINYLKNREAIVYTQPCSTFKQLFHQRMRWISKTKHYTNFKIIVLSFFVLLFYTSMLSTAVLSLINSKYLTLFLMQVIAKGLVDFAMIDEVTRFFKKRRLIKHFWLFELLHLPFSFATGIASQFFKFQWKNRTYNND